MPLPVPVIPAVLPSVSLPTATEMVTSASAASGPVEGSESVIAVPAASEKTSGAPG